ncbi:MAG: hypothetical protein AAF581_11230 [Planctomycetota bacterium]
MIESSFDMKELDDVARNHGDLLANNVFVNLGRSHGKFRKDWLKRLRNEVARGTRQIARQFFYVRSSNLSGKYPADRLKSEFFTTSLVALGLQEGGVHKAKRSRTAIPVGHALTASGRTKKAYKNVSNKLSDLIVNKALIVKNSRKTPGVLLAYEIINPNSTGRRRRGKAFEKHGKGIQRARLIYILTHKSPKRKPVLGFYESWEKHIPLHMKRMAQSVEATLRGIHLK